MKINNTELLCSLGRKEAIDLIRETETVMYKHGVWNSYEKKSTEDVIRKIEASGYGADVRINYGTGVYYVCTPAQADMW